MDKEFWADEITRLYLEGHSLAEARNMVQKMMGERKRKESMSTTTLYEGGIINEK